MIRTWILNLWDSFRTSFWFVPSLCTLAAVVMAGVLPWIDGQVSENVVEHFPWLISTSASARSALGAMAGAMVTVAGVVLSITVVALSMTSSQYGPRLLRTFMSNSSTQFALGMFIATSTYCLLVLREVRGGPEEEAFVPHLSVSLGVLLSVFSIGVLIYFIHEVSLSVQAPTVVQMVAAEIDGSIERLYPDAMGASLDSVEGHGEVVMQLAALGDSYSECVTTQEGYMQAIDAEGVLRLANQHDVVIHLLQRPGDFMVRSRPLAHVWPAGRDADEIERKLNDLVIVGNRRTPRQDAECAILEMVEIAVRALSPGINDPFTAINCVDRLAASLSRFAQKQIPSPFRRDDDGRLRVIALNRTFDDLLNSALNQIRRYGERDIAVTTRLLTGLKLIFDVTLTERDRNSVLQHVKVIAEASEHAIAVESDRKSIHLLCHELLQSVESDLHDHKLRLSEAKVGSANH